MAADRERSPGPRQPLREEKTPKRVVSEETHQFKERDFGKQAVSEELRMPHESLMMPRSVPDNGTASPYLVQYQLRLKSDPNRATLGRLGCSKASSTMMGAEI